MKTRIFTALLALMLVAALFVGCNQSGDNGDTTTGGTEQLEPIIPEDADFAVHYIDVGHADATLIVCDGETLLIDGGNVADASLLKSYLEIQGVTRLDYVVCTNATEEHVGGIAGALDAATEGVGTVYSPVATSEVEAFKSFTKKLEGLGKNITVPKAGDTFEVGDAVVEILGPTKTYKENLNNNSLVLRVVYEDTSFLFVGDMGTAAEMDLLTTDAKLKADVLKVGSHGSGASTSYHFLNAVEPRYAVISVGAENSDEAPAKTVLSRLEKADVKTYRTDLQGDVVCTSNGERLTFQTTKNVSANDKDNDKDGTAAVGAYIGNKLTKKFHDANCATLPEEEKDRVYFDSAQDAEDAGYTACSSCKPK